nr:retrovirus-related Pol polyprotein from transposon TNT 1-94 [Tanacetum cinerariifolium]
MHITMVLQQEKTKMIQAGEQEHEVSLDDNEMVEVKVLMALAEENDAVSKEGIRNGEWVKISMRKLSEAEDFILPNHDTRRILPPESPRNTTDPSVAVTDSLETDYDSVDESSVCSTPLLPLKMLDGAEPISGPKTIKSILRKPIWYLDSRCSRHITGVKSYRHKYVEQPGPKVVFGDDSTCTTEGYGSIKCNGISFLLTSVMKRDFSKLFSPYTPEQNGIAKRKNRTLIEAARTMLSGSIFSKQYY